MSVTMDLGASSRATALLHSIHTMVAEDILPAEREYLEAVPTGGRWTLTERQQQILDTLKDKARSQGLWNLFLTDSEHGAGLSTVDYAYLAEAMGHSVLAPEIFNCNAPDSGNMEVLLRYGTTEQKQRWLQPLLDGEIRSAYAMTEPETASSDATNLKMPAVLDGDQWVLNGEKIWVTGAGDPRCSVLICMVRTENDEAPRHARHSQILVPMDSPGLEKLRPMEVMGGDDAPHGHMHLRFSDVRVPQDHLVLGRGRGFEVAQGRLGPGRIHHCMRAIGMAEHALRLMTERALQREAFGKPLAALGDNTGRIADARMQIEMNRLLTLRAAWAMDHAEAPQAALWISKVKASVPRAVLGIIDDAIQLHGAAGLGQDTELSDLYRWARALRLADGPDEVHRMVVGRAELKHAAQRMEKESA